MANSSRHKDLVRNLTMAASRGTVVVKDAHLHRAVRARGRGMSVESRGAAEFGNRKLPLDKAALGGTQT